MEIQLYYVGVHIILRIYTYNVIFYGESKIKILDSFYKPISFSKVF